MPNPVAPFAVQSGGGTALETPTGGLCIIKAHTGNTNGALTVTEFVIPPKQGPALHTHLPEDEVWYILEGDFRFKAGDEMLRVSTGGMAFGPRGTPHAFQNVGDTSGRLLVITTPRAWSGSSSNLPNLMPSATSYEPFESAMHTIWSPNSFRTIGMSFSERPVGYST